jgi:TolB-like protein/class 3 adenylate cyclase
MVGTSPVASTERLGRRLAAVVSADVVGYSRLVERDEEGTVRRLKENWHSIVRPATELHGGRIVKVMGDGALIEFPSVVEAVRFSLETQQEVEAAEASRPIDERIRYRVGIHLGDVIIDGEDIQGHGVNVSARLQSLAEPGGICISEGVRAALGNSIPLSYEDMGLQEVKNIAEPVRAYRVRTAGLAELPKPAKPRRKRVMALPLVLGTLAVLVAAAGGVYFYRQTPEGTGAATSGPAEQVMVPKSDLPSIVVLPFANLSDDKAQEFFVDGLTEDLIADLSKLSGLFVISRSSAFTYKNQNVRPKQVAEDFGIAYVVNGSVRRASDRVRITVELIEAANDRQIWADRYDRELTDVFAVQDEVKQQIVQALAVKLKPDEQQLASTAPTRSVEAYEFYLRGRQAMNASTFRSMNLAFWAFEKAIALDPEFAEAYASLAMTNALDLTVGAWTRPPQRMRVQAQVLAQKAASLKPSLAIPEIVFAHLSLWDEHYDEAIEHARRAVEHEPGNVDVYMTEALVLTAAGRHREARTAIDEVFRRDPKPSASTYGMLGMIQFAQRDYSGAIATFETYRKQSAEGILWVFPAFLFAAYGEAGRQDEVRAIALPFGGSIINWDLAWQRSWIFYRNPEDSEHLVEGLRKAGAPEFPFDFDPNADAGEKLTGPVLTSLLLGRSFDALCGYDRLKSTIRFGEDGSMSWALREDISDTGRSRIDADKACIVLPLLTRDREACYSVYRNGSNPTLNLGRGYDYVMVGPALCYFSPQK